MSVADIVILVVIALSLAKGFSRGLVQEVFALLGWVLGILVGLAGYKAVAPLMASLISTPSLQQASAFLLLCLGVVVLCSLIALLTQGLLKALALGPADKALGAVFGAARGLLIVLLVIGLMAPYLKNDPWWQKAGLLNALLPYVPLAHQLTDKVAQQVRHLPQTSLTLPNVQNSQH